MPTDAIEEQRTENKGGMINGNKACENEEWRQSLVTTRLLRHVRFCFVGRRQYFTKCEKFDTAQVSYRVFAKISLEILVRLCKKYLNEDYV